MAETNIKYLGNEYFAQESSSADPGQSYIPTKSPGFCTRYVLISFARAIIPISIPNSLFPQFSSVHYQINSERDNYNFKINILKLCQVKPGIKSSGCCYIVISIIVNSNRLADCQPSPVSQVIHMSPTTFLSSRSSDRHIKPANVSAIHSNCDLQGARSSLFICLRFISHFNLHVNFLEIKKKYLYSLDFQTSRRILFNNRKTLLQTVTKSKLFSRGYKYFYQPWC